MGCFEATYAFDDAVEFQTALLIANTFVLVLLTQFERSRA